MAPVSCALNLPNFLILKHPLISKQCCCLPSSQAPPPWHSPAPASAVRWRSPARWLPLNYAKEGSAANGGLPSNPPSWRFEFMQNAVPGVQLCLCPFFVFTDSEGFTDSESKNKHKARQTGELPSKLLDLVLGRKNSDFSLSTETAQTLDKELSNW